MSTQPKIDVFVTSILSSTAIRSRHERVIRHLSSARIEFTTHDVCEENAKKYWKLKSGGNNELPCLLVDGERVGVSSIALDDQIERNGQVELILFVLLCFLFHSLFYRAVRT